MTDSFRLKLFFLCNAFPNPTDVHTTIQVFQTHKSKFQTFALLVYLLTVSS